MINKKGESHLEMILSFIIFISFLIFLFIIFPVNNTEQGKAGLDIANTEILNFTNAKITSVGVALNSTAIDKIIDNENAGKAKKTCFYFQTNLTIIKMIAKDDSDAIVEATSKIYTSTAWWVYINGIKKFYQIYYSPYLTEKTFTNTDCFFLTPKLGLRVGVPSAYRALSYDRVKSLNASYYSDYSKLLTRFGMPKNSNFGFIITDMSGKEIFRAMREKTGRGGSSARNIPIQMSYTDGTFQEVILNIQAW